jgi:hypothetical protein
LQPWQTQKERKEGGRTPPSLVLREWVVKKFLPLLLLVLAVPSPASGATRAAALPSYAGQCGLPAQQPIWFEYGWPYPAYNAILGKPGIVIGASGTGYPDQMRSAGATTVYFDLHLNNRIGTSTKPADPTGLQAKAQKFFAAVVQQLGCQTPVIVENELAGPGLVTPWSDTYAQYRANALSFLQDLAALGAHPVLLIPGKAYIGGDALQWWQQAAQVAEIVREIYVPATATWKQGPVLGNRNLRIAYRGAVSNLTDAGIPTNKIGIMVSFATTNGFGGRNGLEPASAWYDVAKWQALAAQQVAAETGIASVWSWGWAQWSAAEQDPAKAYALCAWLWTRSPTLCDAPKAIGRDFDVSKKEGQLGLIPGTVQCLVGKSSLAQSAIDALQRVTGDRETAYSALYERLVESQYTSVSTADVVAAERAVIAQQFNGSQSAYAAALRAAHATVAIARGILGDELRRARVETTLSTAVPSATQIETFYQSYPDLQVRLVQAKPRPSWLPAAKGFALSQVAPDTIFTLPRGKTTAVRTTEGDFGVKILNEAQTLGAVPLSKVSSTIAAALRQFARGDAFDKWTVGKQRVILDNALCKSDDLPQPGVVDLTQFLPFLRLG